MEKCLAGISFKSFEAKPIDSEIVESKIEATNHYDYYSLSTIADYVGKKGHTIVPAYLHGGMKENHFEEIQIFMMDFDGEKYDEKKQKMKGTNITYNEIKERAESYGLRIAFAYKTLSCPDTDPFYKFRIGFVFERPVLYFVIAKYIYYVLLKVFPEADHACSNLDRCFLGGKELIDYDEDARIDLMQLHKLTYSVLDNNNHLNRNLAALSKKTGIGIINNRLAIGPLSEVSLFGCSADSTILKIIEGSTAQPFFYIPRGTLDVCELHKLKTCMTKTYRLNMSKKIGICPLLDDFEQGVELDHMERFLLLTNLMHIEGGIKHFMEVLANFYSQETYDKWVNDLRYIKGYAPQSCCENCRYFDKCERAQNTPNIVLKLLNDKNVYIKAEKYVPIDQAEEELMNNIKKAIQSVGKGIHLIHGQTGLGKTRSICNIVEEKNNKRFLIAEPTCDMKSELCEDLIAIIGEGNVKEIRSVRDKSSLISKEDSDTYMLLHESGRHKEAVKYRNMLLEKVLKETPEAFTYIEELKELKDGLNGIDDKRVVVTTHAKLFTLGEDVLSKFDYVIIDEDILLLHCLGNQKCISRGTLSKVAESGIEGYSERAREMLHAKVGVYYKLSHTFENLAEWDDVYYMPDDEDENDASLYIEQGVEDNISDLSKAGAYYLDENGTYTYLCVSKLPDMKYIVLSATYDPKVYQDYFGDKVKVVVYEANKARYNGKLVQYIYHSCGRRDLAKEIAGERKIDKMIKFRNDFFQNTTTDTISFKKYDNYPGINGCGLHFGNAIGVNNLKGKDIAIIGTPYRDEKAYLLPGCYMYGEDMVNDDEMRRQRVDYNGRNFVIMSYHHEELKNLEMYFIESDQEQCIGRARLLRYNCTVLLLSSFPAQQAEIHTIDYLAEGEDKMDEEREINIKIA